jgi:hypothetical protein
VLSTSVALAAWLCVLRFGIGALIAAGRFDQRDIRGKAGSVRVGSSDTRLLGAPSRTAEQAREARLTVLSPHFSIFEHMVG